MCYWHPGKVRFCHELRHSLRLIFHAKKKEKKPSLFVYIEVKPRKANGLDVICVSSNENSVHFSNHFQFVLLCLYSGPSLSKVFHIWKSLSVSPWDTRDSNPQKHGQNPTMRWRTSCATAEEEHFKGTTKNCRLLSPTSLSLVNKQRFQRFRFHYPANQFIRYRYWWMCGGVDWVWCWCWLFKHRGLLYLCL